MDGGGVVTARIAYRHHPRVIVLDGIAEDRLQPLVVPSRVC
jgi:hypothetical protein